MENFESQLREFGIISDQQNVPVGFVITSGGKFAIKFSLSGFVILKDTLAEVLEYFNQYNDSKCQ